MIPEQCYKDLRNLIAKLTQHSVDFRHDKLIVSESLASVHALESIIQTWKVRDEAEIDDMADYFEKSEKDCMWDRD